MNTKQREPYCEGFNQALPTVNEVAALAICEGCNPDNTLCSDLRRAWVQVPFFSIALPKRGSAAVH